MAIHDEPDLCPTLYNSISIVCEKLKKSKHFKKLQFIQCTHQCQCTHSISYLNIGISETLVLKSDFYPLILKCSETDFSLDVDITPPIWIRQYEM